MEKKKKCTLKILGIKQGLKLKKNVMSTSTFRMTLPSHRGGATSNKIIVGRPWGRGFKLNDLQVHIDHRMLLATLHDIELDILIEFFN